MNTPSREDEQSTTATKNGADDKEVTTANESRRGSPGLTSRQLELFDSVDDRGGAGLKPNFPHPKRRERRSQGSKQPTPEASFAAQELRPDSLPLNMIDLPGTYELSEPGIAKGTTKGALPSQPSRDDIQGGASTNGVAVGAQLRCVRDGLAAPGASNSYVHDYTAGRSTIPSDSRQGSQPPSGLIVAELVDSYQDRIDFVSSVAVEESLCNLLRHNRRTQIIVSCVLLSVIALVVGLAASLSSDSPLTTGKAREPLGAYATIDGSDIDGLFGSSLSFSADATRLAIGSPGSDGGAGSVEVYEEHGEGSSTAWELVGGRLVGNTIEDKLGTALSLSRDGRTLATCAPGGVGTVSVYSLSSIRFEWVRIGDSVTGIVCRSVSLSRNGNVFVIAGIDSLSGRAVISIFEILGGKWTLIGTLPGNTAALSADGRRVAVGTESNVTIGAPAVLSVFEFASIGKWTQLGSDVLGDIGLYDHGWLAVTNEDGSIVAIGGYFVDPSTKLDETDADASISALSAKVYRFADEGWSQIGGTLHQYVEDSHSVYPVSLSANGEVLAIGDPGKVVAQGDNSGHAHVARLEKKGNRDEEWVHIAADVDGEAAGDQFGIAVVLSADGGLVAVGAPFNRVNGYEHGRVQVYDFSEVASEGSF